MKDIEKYTVQADIMKALAHPSRLYIVDLLEGGEMCVCDIAVKVGSDISTVSRHLDKLRQAGIIKKRKVGTSVLYSLQMNCLAGMFSCVQNVICQRADALKAMI